jgi:hypothetical protein
MLQTILDALGAARYSQHSICLTNDPLMMFLYIAGDLTTWASYFTIGLALLLRREIPVQLPLRLKGLYGAFIFLCGLSHLSSVMTLFWGVYRLDVFITATMASVSAVTAVMTVKIYEEAA